MTPSRAAVAFLGGVLLLTTADLATKLLAVNRLDDGPIELPGPIALRLSRNRGIAFGLLSDVPPAVLALATLIIGAVAINLWRAHNAPTIPVVLVIAGAAANLIDRLQGGGVVDMIHTGWWPTFNLADVFIATGVTAWIINVGSPHRTGHERPTQASD